MAQISIPIKGSDSAPCDPNNVEVHLVHKDGMTDKYIREVFARCHPALIKPDRIAYICVQN